MQILRAVLLGAIVGACTAGPTTLPEGGYSVRLVNDGGTPLLGVHVVTGDDVPAITQAVLEAGEVTSPARVRVVHEFPYVRAVAGGQELLLHPVEGFSGFNAPLPPGAYVIRLRYSGGQQLDMRVVPEACDAPGGWCARP